MRKARRAKKRRSLMRSPARERREQLSADQVTAQDEEKIDADPAETMDSSGKRESHDAAW